MRELYEFITAHSQRGDCTCGRCFDAPANPQQPSGHTADMVFFKVAAKDSPDAEKLRSLITANQSGEFTAVDLFDGKEHNYMELGGWIGDQGMALTLMGLGTVLGLWKLYSPAMLGILSSDPLAQQMAGMGLLSIKADSNA